MKKPPRKMHYRNFTLTEVMIAVFIVSISTLGLYSIMMLAKESVVASRLRLEAQRYSYDVANRLLRTTKENLDSGWSIVHVNSFYLDGYPDYLVSTTKYSDEDTTELTTDLRGYKGKVEVVLSNLLNPDTFSNNQHAGYRIDVTVRWTFKQPLSYTTTVYKYFVE